MMVRLAQGWLLWLCTGIAFAQAPDWVQTSNEHAEILLQAEARFAPESASMFVPGYDDQIADLRPGFQVRYGAALTKARQALEALQKTETSPPVRQDLAILIAAATQEQQGLALREQYLLPYVDVPQLIHSGIQGLLQSQNPPQRRAHAITRLKQYAGLMNGTPLTVLARARYEERATLPDLLGPYRGEVEQGLANIPTYLAGLRELFEEFPADGSEQALQALEKQFDDYAAWIRESVLPRARDDFRMPAPLYAYQLKQYGIDLEPLQLVARAEQAFMETRAAMQLLAPRVAERLAINAGDYRDVIRALKQQQLEPAEVEPYYRSVINEIDTIIAREQLVSLPQRPMVMRLASAAESAAQPAPHFVPAPLIGNSGEQGQFVLPTSVPQAEGNNLAYDDFSFNAAAWTVSAHEGRPGHELQFTSMVERGVSLARSLFAFNSVNVEGWALYAEAEMVPFEPPEGQLIALQLRLLRAARAMLDPLLNLGYIDRERAHRILKQEVVLSEAMTQQELDRYTFRAPGQAGAYLYGYTRLLELRMATELAMGERFDARAFNDFVLDQGLLPPDLLMAAVVDDFIPARSATTHENAPVAEAPVSD